MKKFFIILIIFLLFISFNGCKKKTPDEGGKIEPTKEITDLEINAPSEIYLNETANLEITTYPNNDFKYTISIRDNSDEKEIISIDNNIITGLNEGTAYITVTSIDKPDISKSITINVLHRLLEDVSFTATEIVGFFGSDASSEYEINYQIKNTKSYVLLTTKDDPNFNNATSYYGKGYYFEQIDDRLQYNFYPRNVWHVKISGLNSNTEYIYKINNGDDTYSDIYSFKTAGGDKTSFLFLTDNHYYEKTDGTITSAAVSEQTIKNAKSIDPNISFIVGAGDRVDHGGNDLGWQTYFKYAKSLQDYPFIDTPGNHEYYSNLTTYGNTYFSIYTAGSDNGCPGLNGSTCYTIHNDTLLIMMDNSTNKAYDEQIAWVSNLLETKEYKYSIIVFHKPCNLPGTQDYNPDLMKLCDKYSIDLVLCGHYHTENVSQNYYMEAPSSNPYLGTTYFLGTFSGIKSASSPENAINQARGYIVDIDENNITIRSMLANGTLLNTWTITNRTTDQIIEKSHDELISSIKYNIDEENNKISFDFNEYFFGNVKKVYVKEILRNKLNNDMVFPSPAYTSISIDNVVENYDYNFELTVEFKDGYIYKNNYIWSRHENINLREKLILEDYIELTFDQNESDLKYQIKNYEIYVNDKYYSKQDYEIDGRFNNRIILTDLQENTNYNIKVVFYNFSSEYIFSETINAKTL